MIDNLLVKLVFLFFTILNAYRFWKSRDRWFLGLSFLFGLMVMRRSLPELIFNLALAGVLAWVIWLAIWKFHPKLRFRRALGNPKLRALDTEEREWRKTLAEKELEHLQTWELLTEQRFSLPDAIEFVKRHLETKTENAAQADSHEADKEAYLTEQRIAEAEKKELAVNPVPTPMEVLDLETGNSLWLKLDALEDNNNEDLAYTAPARCTIWKEKPKALVRGSESFVSIADLIEFPPDPETTTPQFWDAASLEFKSIFRKQCLAAGIEVVDDGRERFDFQIAEKVFVIMTKYLCWKTDLALDPERQQLWVRISELQAEVWSQGSNEAGEPKFQDYERVPAFVYPIPIKRLMPSLHAIDHFESLEALDKSKD